jgi:raw score 3.64
MAIFRSHFVTFEKYGGKIPTTWVKATIGDVVSVARGASPRPIQKFMSETGMPWVKISDASASVSKYLFGTAECIIPEGVSGSRTVVPGMMIVSNSASPGLPMLMEITACVHDGWLIIDDYKHVSQEFMYYHFLAERQGLVSSSNGSVFNNLKTDIVKAHPIIIPDAETMSTVTHCFCQLNQHIKHNAKEIMALTEFRNNILSRLSSD